MGLSERITNTVSQRPTKSISNKLTGTTNSRSIKTIGEKPAKQVVVPRRRATRNQRFSSSFNWQMVRARIHILWRIAQVAAVIAIVAFTYYSIISSSWFQLSAIEVNGNMRISAEDIKRVVKQNLSNTLLGTNLTKLQEQLQTFPWVKTAYVTRILPDTLRIRIEERKPLVLARFQTKGAALWIDEEAVVLGEYDNVVDKDVPPLVVGFSSATDENARAENRERIEIYKRLIWALDSGPEKYAAQVEEIDLSNLKDVRLSLRRPSLPNSIEVDLGDRDFRVRLIRALTVLDALQRQDIVALKSYQLGDKQELIDPKQISFISVVHPTKIAIRPVKKIAIEDRVPATPRTGEEQ